MTHEQANTMRPNPHYAIGEQYRVNCQSCVVTYEMRRRGIDAETVPNFKEKDSVTDFLSRYAYKAWRDAISLGAGRIRISGISSQWKSLKAAK